MEKSNFLIIIIISVILLISYGGEELSAQSAGKESFEDMHLGLFVHYMHPAKEYRWGETTWADGSKVKSLDELADNLDVEDLAETASSMRAQYVIFTTWHANMNALYPSEVINKWIPGHSSKRDVIRDLINALDKKKIKLVLYVHPSDAGPDFSKKDQELTGWNDGHPYTRWNDFINEVIAEVADRYGDDIYGYYIDGGLPEQVDAPRLRKTIIERMPDAWLIQNSGLNPECVDYGAYERMTHPYPASTWLRCQTITHEWWAMSGTVSFCPELAYQYTILQAAVEGRKGGGVTWSFGPHPGGRWELGVRSFCVRLGELIDKAEPSLFATRPSKAFITPDKTPLIGLPYVATESIDGSKTFVHVLRPPKGKNFFLPNPHDSKRFISARLLNKKEKIDISQNATGITLTVNSPDIWDDVDTIIELK